MRLLMMRNRGVVVAAAVAAAVVLVVGSRGSGPRLRPEGMGVGQTGVGGMGVASTVRCGMGAAVGGGLVAALGLRTAGGGARG